MGEGDGGSSCAIQVERVVYSFPESRRCHKVSQSVKEYHRVLFSVIEYQKGLQRFIELLRVRKIRRAFRRIKKSHLVSYAS